MQQEKEVNVRFMTNLGLGRVNMTCLSKTWILSGELLHAQGSRPLSFVEKQSSHSGRSNEGPRVPTAINTTNYLSAT